MSTTVRYDPQVAISCGRSAAEMRLGEVQDELEREFEVAVALAGEYADHLAIGGDPTDYPKPDDLDIQQHGLVRVAREGVFDAWNASRERQSVSYPWGQGMPYRWIVHEYLLDRLGQSCSARLLARLGPHGERSPQSVAQAALSLRAVTDGAVQVRRIRGEYGEDAWLAEAVR